MGGIVLSYPAIFSQSHNGFRLAFSRISHNPNPNFPIGFSEGEIEMANGKEMSSSEFVDRYMENNQPVVLTGLMDDWRAGRDWVTDEGNPNLQFSAPILEDPKSSPTSLAKG
ncbi:hypothetical protein ABKV19_004265 [Rosa sericea]